MALHCICFASETLLYIVNAQLKNTEADKSNLAIRLAVAVGNLSKSLYFLFGLAD
jgi:hypothetical protein